MCMCHRLLTILTILQNVSFNYMFLARLTSWGSGRDVSVKPLGMSKKTTGQFPNVFVMTKTVNESQNVCLSDSNRLFFVPKPNQSASTAL